VSAVAAGAKEQVARLLTLVPYLHSRGEVRLEDAARDLGLEPAQLLRDLRVLLMCGLPGGYPDDLIDVDLDALEDPEGDGVIRVSNADYLARPLRLTATEASALIVALRALRSESSAETQEVVDRVLSKLEAAAAEGSTAARIDVGESADRTEAALRAELAAAVRRQRQVKLTYYVPSRDEQSERVVDPRGIVTAAGFDYLDAYCHSAESPRLFRLDRIHEAEVLETPVAEPAAPREVGQGFLLPAEGTTAVRLRLDPQARWVPDYYPTESVRRRAGGVLEVTMRVADPRWLERLLLRLSPHARVLDPPELAEAHRVTAEATLRWYT
jgi:proteasome accessory factor C